MDTTFEPYEHPTPPTLELWWVEELRQVLPKSERLLEMEERELEDRARLSRNQPQYL